MIAAAVAAGEHEAAASRGPSHASGVDADHNASSPNRSASYGAQRSISTSSARRGGAARGGATLSSTAGASGRRKRRMSEAQQQQQAYGGGGEMDTPQSEFDGWGAGAGDDGDGGDDDGDGEGEDGGKRRIQRACDLCRRKKIRCDGAVGTGPKGAKRNIREFCTYAQDGYGDNACGRHGGGRSRPAAADSRVTAGGPCRRVARLATANRPPPAGGCVVCTKPLTVFILLSIACLFRLSFAIACLSRPSLSPIHWPFTLWPLRH